MSSDRWGPFEIFVLAVVVLILIWGIVTVIQAL